ncbi:serine/threonine-protein phosphatase 6 regulatory ankyrin repeat subunit C-like isoform X3 [Actinia tenebrosa]|uniref:Serine/threonine-protein phosphatase 6 regulatory ankyrin repeat subunit C-like isoform X3 n=1 Tax=Actinia tenebrosa TaxID=6105 RepID=A0A6P8J665_ACTTE|nr:serine/threonine-protein phosphatase 6 regulatory ankyrin repeat subunit C-like isoform X3 [Actinia tenebrosa]
MFGEEQMSLSEEDGNLDLFNAVKNNNESAIRGSLDAGADVNITDESWKRTPMFYAVLGNFENVVHVLIKAGANVNIKDREENSCLFFAVLCDHSNIARALIDAKADVNAIDKFQKRTPIFYAVSNGNGELVDALIDASTDVNKTDSDGQTALFCALRSKNDNIVRAIIDAGADVNKTDSDGQTALFYALRSKNDNIVRAIIDGRADVNKTDSDGQTALFCALRSRNDNIVRAIIDAGADVNKTDIVYQTALFSAVENDNESIVRVLIDAGADVNKTDVVYQTALFSAVRQDNESIVQALIDAGVDSNKTDKYGKTALFIAVDKHNESIVQALIDAGAVVNKTDKYGNTAFFIAVLHDNKSIVQALIDAGADVNETHRDLNETSFFDAHLFGNNYESAYHDGETALFGAVREGNESIVRALIDGGADVNKTDNDGQTALFIAVDKQNESIVRALIDAGVDVNKTDKYGETAWISAGSENNVSLIPTLIDAGADVKTDSDGPFALYCAILNNNESIVRVLIDAGVVLNNIVNDGETALFSAVENGKESIAQALIEAGADVNKTNYYGKTAMFSAIEYENESIVQALIEAGADVNKTDDDGKTAMFSAIEYENESIVQALIDAGVDVNKTDKYGNTALFNAVENNNESIVRALIDAGVDVNKTDKYSKTALFCVSLFFNFSSGDSIDLLIDAGSDVNLPDNKGETPLFSLVRSQLDIHVKTLVEKGKALTNVRNQYGRTPLFYALQRSPVVALYLLYNGGNLYLKDNCNLSILSFFIEEMLHDEIRFDRSGRFDLTEQLNLLCRRGVTEKLVVKSLIEVLFCKIVLMCTPLGEVRTSYSYFMHKGCLSEFLSMADYQTKMTIENILEQVSSEQLSQVVPSFVNLGADPNSVDSHGNTLLHYVTLLPFVDVSQKEVVETCHLLWKYGASMNIKNHQGQTPLLFCLSELSLHWEWLLRTDGVKMLVEVCRLLLNCGTNVNDTLPNGESVFHLLIDLFQKGLRLQDEAVRQELLKEMFNLLQLFSDANCKQAESFKNSSGHLYLLLHSWASLTLPYSENYSRKVTHNYTFEELLKAILQLLLKCGAKQNARDDDERTPLHHCKTWSAVKLLIDAGAKTDDVDSSGHPTLLAAAGRQTFLERSDRFYPDVLEDPKAFWRTAIEMNLDPWTVDQHENSVLSNMIECKAFVLVKALIEVTCEDKHIESHTIAYSLLSTICNDQSTHARWKTNLVEIILNSRKTLLVNLDVPLRFCCKNIIELGSSDDSSHDSLHPSKGLKRKFADNEFEKHGSTQPMLKKIKTTDGRCSEEKTDGQCSEEETDGQCSEEKTENAKNSDDLVHYDSVHCEIAQLLLSYGADCRISDSTGKSCLDLAETCPELKHILMQPIDMNKISKRIPWDSVSERYKNMLAKVSRGQEKQIVGSFWYHKDYIGSGSYGHVFTGINENDGREVAIKRIEKLRMVRPEDQREITNLANLADCKQVVSHVCFLEDIHFSYIVLELMEGDLEHYFSERTVDKRKSVLLCKDIVEGLRYLHERKIIHRDLKPGNILYKTHPTLCLKIADFGLSRYCRVNNTSTTLYGRTIVGTRCWIAPEILTSQSAGENFTKNSDTFSCGLLLHYILSEQRHPFSPAPSSNPHFIEDNIIKDKMEG